MNLFVTGATGFIGSHFVEAAMLQGHRVIALKRTPESKPRITLTNQPDWLVAEMSGVTVADLLDCDAIIHLAASGVLAQNTSISSLIESNVLEPLKLFENAIKANVQRFVAAGTCFEYGKSGDRYEFIPEDAPLEPTNPYASSKAAAAMAFESFARQNSCSLVLARIFHTYGEGEAPGKFWPSLRKAAVEGRDFSMSGGDQVRDFIPVEEAVKQLLKLAEQEPISGCMQVCHVGSGRAETLREFAIRQWAAFNASGQIVFGSEPYRSDEVMRYVPRLPVLASH